MGEQRKFFCHPQNLTKNASLAGEKKGAGLTEGILDRCDIH